MFNFIRVVILEEVLVLIKSCFFFLLVVGDVLIKYLFKIFFVFLLVLSCKMDIFEEV